jgi:hypothetical protein
MSTNHNRIKVADLETNEPNKTLVTNQDGELEFINITGGGDQDLQSIIENGSFATLNSGDKVTFEDADTFNKTNISGHQIEINTDANGDQVILSPDKLSFYKSDNSYVQYDKDGIKYTNDDGGLIMLALGDIIEGNNITLKIPSNLTTGTYTLATLDDVNDNFVHKTGEVTEIIDGYKIFQFPTRFRGDASASYIRIDSDYLTFITESYDNNSIKLTAKQNSGAENENYTQELQAKSGIIALLDDLNTPVSATTSGIINNISLQELGGTDKLINGIRIGRGSGTGIENTALGFDVLKSNTSGEANTGLGESALSVNTTGSYNVAAGDWALKDNTTGFSNTAVGCNAGLKNTTGSYNTAIGTAALEQNLYGTQNVAIGPYAMSKTIGTDGSNIFGHRCVAIGSAAMRDNTTGNGIAIGNVALGKQTTGMWNIGLGVQAGSGITTGGGNVIIAGTGFIAAGGGVTTGNNNLIVAPNNGNTTGITTGSGNIVIGKAAGLAAAAENTITISDGVGNIALTKSTSGELKVPNLTQALIISGGATSLINKSYADNMGAIDNSTTIALSAAALNTAYPNAINGFRVHCSLISGGALTYEKTATGWIKYAVTAVV